MVVAGAERHKIMEQWAERRCDFMTMITGFLYKPSSYNGSAGQFAVDNFNFCVGQIAQKTLKAGTAPVQQLMRKQVDAQGTILTAQNGLRTSLAKTTGTINEKFTWFYDKYKQGIYLYSRIGQGIASAMRRIGAMANSLVYLMLTAYTGVMNTMDLSVTVAIIIAAILMVIPFVNVATYFLTIPTMAFAVNWKIQSNKLCFARGTPVMTANGNIPVEQLVVGQKLADGSIVEGMFTFNGLDTELYLLNGVLVSGSHLVYGPGGVCAVENHPDARLTTTRSSLLYCPITSSRVVYTPPNSLTNKPTKFADWEEVSGHAEDDYDSEVRKILQFKEPLLSSTLPSGLRGHVSVITKENGLVLLSGVKIGEHILDCDDKYSEVIGLCRRTVKVADSAANFTDGTMYYDFNGASWKYLDDKITTAIGSSSVDVYQLITNSGTYAVISDEGAVFVIRDATEVGLHRIDSLTPLVLQHLNSKT